MWAWETTARYLFKGCRKMVVAIPMSQNISDVGALKAYRQGSQIIVEGVWIPTPCPETDTSQPQKPCVTSAVPSAPFPLLTSPPCPSVSERRVLS